ncbi:MAG: protein-L-isoaspartate(D-aspartate) O-methyltransferase [Deltaproteobacteria bacterium]|nr:protein-L-isoaspartate(D-aspartate) O-methyltransferase [Deltaproteobacteria bacterium]
MSAAAYGGDDRPAERERMVAEQIAARGVSDARVLAALRKVPRHRFMPEAVRDLAYEDRALPIENGQTISQPYIVAVMSEAARVKPGDRVLEVGTGSGYQAAVLAEMGADLDSIEIVPALADSAAKVLGEMGYARVRVHTGDGYRGLPERAPFDAILVTAAPDHVPQPLLDQLAIGGRLVIPVGASVQELRVIERTKDGTAQHSIFPVMFVPMTGEAQRGRE